VQTDAAINEHPNIIRMGRFGAVARVVLSVVLVAEGAFLALYGSIWADAGYAVAIVARELHVSYSPMLGVVVTGAIFGLASLACLLGAVALWQDGWGRGCSAVPKPPPTRQAPRFVSSSGAWPLPS
jgi:hypothetical protein